MGERMWTISNNHRLRTRLLFGMRSSGTTSGGGVLTGSGISGKAKREREKSNAGFLLSSGSLESFIPWLLRRMLDNRVRLEKDGRNLAIGTGRNLVLRSCSVSDE